jgi:hypothetical protein
MRALILVAALAVAAPNIASADADIIPPPAGTGEVAVYRGRDATVASPVPVHRGSAIRPAHLAPQPAPEPDVGSVGGRRIWFVDRAEGQLTSCRVFNTTVIGRFRIGCTRGRLPG